MRELLSSLLLAAYFIGGTWVVLHGDEVFPAIVSGDPCWLEMAHFPFAEVCHE